MAREYTSCYRCRYVPLRLRQLTTFEVDHIPPEFLGKDQVLRNLAGIACLPETRDEFRGHLPAHDLQNVSRSNCFGIRKPIQEGADAKEMIAVALSDIDRSQVLAARRDPFHCGVRLLDGKKGVDDIRIQSGLSTSLPGFWHSRKSRRKRSRCYKTQWPMDWMRRRSREWKRMMP